MTKIEEPNLLNYAEDTAKADIVPMNAEQQETNKTTNYYPKMPWKDSHSPTSQT